MLLKKGENNILRIKHHHIQPYLEYSFKRTTFDEFQCIIISAAGCFSRSGEVFCWGDSLWLQGTCSSYSSKPVLPCEVDFLFSASMNWRVQIIQTPSFSQADIYLLFIFILSPVTSMKFNSLGQRIMHQRERGEMWYLCFWISVLLPPQLVQITILQSNEIPLLGGGGG